MNVKVIKTKSSDRLILVDSAKLMEYVVSKDMKCRNTDIVEDAYHRDWFYEYEGEVYFTPPSAYIENGRILFIDGRHRSILLARYLKKFPFLIGNIDMNHIGMKPKKRSLEVMKAIKIDDFAEYEIFSLPELEFGNFESA